MLKQWPLLLCLLLGASACNLLQLAPSTDPFYDVALKQQPNNQAALYAQGQALIRQGQYKEAREYFKHLARIDAARPSTWLGLGRCQFELHEFRQAKKSFQRALKLAPSQEASLGLAASALMNGETATTERLAREIEAQYGQSAALLRLRGDMAFMAGDPDKALAAYKQSLALDPAQRGIQDHIRDLQDFLTSPR